MSKFYYNGILLPEIPSDVLKEYPYCVMSINKSKGQYQILFSKEKWFFDTTNVCVNNHCNDTEPYYHFYEGDAGWTFNSNGNYVFGEAERRLLWSNEDVPYGSPTGSSVYFYSTKPLEEKKCTGCFVTNTPSVSASSGSFELGSEFLCNKQVVAVGARVFVPPAQKSSTSIFKACLWDSKGEKIAETNNLSCCDSDKWLVFAFKEPVLLSSGAKYTVSANFDSYYITEEVQNSEISSDFTFVQSRYGSGGFYPSTQFNQKMYGLVDISYEIDSSSESTSYEKYLVLSGEKIYSTLDGELFEVSEGVVTADTFLTYGSDVIPTWDKISFLNDPEILFWQNDSEKELLYFTAIMSATAKPQALYAEPFYLTDSTIAGIDSVSCEFDGEPLISLSFDGGGYEYYNNGWVSASDTEGMLPDVLTSITSDVWETKVAGVQSIQIRVILNTNEDTLQSIKFTFINE